jgi:hypothetical protein
MIALAEDLAAALDPVRFAEAAGFPELDPWQRRALRSASRRQLFNCSRQSGKTSVAAIRAAWEAIYEAHSLILLLSPSLRQSQEAFRACLDIYRARGAPVPPTAESALRLELANGSRIVSLPGHEQTIRGYSGVRTLIVDEAARVEDDLYKAVRPMLAVSGGRLLALSTPFGRRGWWCEAWRGDEPWERFEVPATECPRIPAAFLEEERRVMGEIWFKQEYSCEFLDSADQFFGGEDIEAALAAPDRGAFLEGWP